MEQRCRLLLAEVRLGFLFWRRSDGRVQTDESMMATGGGAIACLEERNLMLLLAERNGRHSKARSCGELSKAVI